MFKKFFRSVKDKLFGGAHEKPKEVFKKEEIKAVEKKPVKPKRLRDHFTEIFKAWKETAKYKGGVKQLTRSDRRNFIRPKLKPPTKMESPDNQTTQMSDGRMDAQKRSDRAEYHRKNGRFYHKPWPFKKKVA